LVPSALAKILGWTKRWLGMPDKVSTSPGGVFSPFAICYLLSSFSFASFSCWRMHQAPHQAP
jgi:hypothetical protein